MTTIAEGVFKQTRIARQAAKGTLSVAAGQVLRRTQSVFELQKETYTTQDEIVESQQLVSSRHGVKLVNGSLNGILSPGTYSEIVAAILRRDYAAVADITAMSITIAASGGGYTITRAAGSFLTDGIKVGMVVRLTAGAFNAANLNKNVLVTAVTALVVTGLVLNGSTMTAEGPIAAATMSVPGKVTYPPATGHTSVWFTVEEWYPDVPYSERNLDVRFGQAQFNLPGSGNATVQFQAQGLNQTNDAAAFFAAPAVETTTGALVAASGLLLVGGVAQATITDLQFTLNGNQTPADGVVGSNVRPGVFRGKIMASGQFTAYFDSGTIPAMFNDETDTTLVSALAADGTAAADFITFTLSKVNVNSSTPDDGEKGLKRTYQFVAEYNAAGGAALATQKSTIQVQDSQAV